MEAKVKSTQSRSALKEKVEANRKAKVQEIDEMIANETAKAQAEIDAKVKSIQSKATLKEKADISGSSILEEDLTST